MKAAESMVQVRRPSGQNRFSAVPSAEIQRSAFDRSHGLKTTFEADSLIPIFVDEVLPGDTYTMRMHGMCRVFSPLKAPIMDNLYLDVHFFFVPNRLVWLNWEKFCGAQDAPGDPTDYTVPILSGATAVGTGVIGDYMGLPIGLVPNDIDVNALPFRAYQLIYNSWYRDQNLIAKATVTVTDVATGNAYGNQPYKRAKRHDYFTSCLPWPQKGDAVSVPLGTAADVHTAATAGDNPTVYSDGLGDYQKLALGAAFVEISAGTGTVGDQLYADLSSATAATINQLRQAFQIQRLLERDARGGTRYVEILKSHFNVTSPDFRLQRPEFLGGGKTFINVSPVANTSATPSTGQGTLAGVGTASVNGIGFAKSFVEHGYVLGIASVRADLTYQQGLHRMYSRQTRYDFYWPVLAQIGEQAVLKKELFVTGTSTDDDVFGYQERYAEYRYAPSRVSGKFRSDAVGSLDLWHLAEDFASQPALNQAFIESAVPMARVQAVTTEPDFILDAWFDLKCARPMPLYGVPGLIDHF